MHLILVTQSFQTTPGQARRRVLRPSSVTSAPLYPQSHSGASARDTAFPVIPGPYARNSTKNKRQALLLGNSGFLHRRVRYAWISTLFWRPHPPERPSVNAEAGLGHDPIRPQLKLVVPPRPTGIVGASNEPVHYSNDLGVRESLAVTEAGLEGSNRLRRPYFHEARELGLEGHDFHQTDDGLGVGVCRLEALDHQLLVVAEEGEERCKRKSEGGGVEQTASTLTSMSGATEESMSTIKASTISPMNSRCSHLPVSPE